MLGLGLQLKKGRLAAKLNYSYYVDSVNGLDTNDGLTAETAWKTISKVNSSSFAEGDIIGFKKGGVWRETLIVPSDNIRLAAYGSGVNPIIDGTEIISDWELAELSPNVDFETGVGGWTGSVLSWQQTAIGERTNVAKLTANNTDFREIDTLFAPAASQYTLSFDVYIPSANTTVSTVRIREGASTYIWLGHITPVRDAWVNFELTWNVTSPNNKLFLYMTNGASVTACTVGDIVYLDNVSIRPADTYYDAAVNVVVPRLVYKDDLVQTKFVNQYSIENNGWYYKTGVLTYRNNEGIPTGIAASARNYCLTTNGKSNVKIDSGIIVKWGNYKRFQDNYLENILPTLGQYAEPTVLISPDGNQIDIWSWGHYAYSTDGVKFSIPVPVSMGTTLHHHIMLVGSTYYYYGGTSDYKKLYTSTDRINFTEVGIVLTKGAAGQWDDSGLGNLFVWKEDSNWYMLYEASKTDSSGFKIGLATSADGINWTKYSSNPVINYYMAGNAEIPRVNNEIIKHEDKYYMYFHSQHFSPNVNGNILRAYSTDLINWTIEGAILDNRSIHGSPYITHGDHAMCEFKGKSYLFFTPSNQQNAYHIDCVIDNRPLAEMLALTP